LYFAATVEKILRNHGKLLMV